VEATNRDVRVKPGLVLRRLRSVLKSIGLVEKGADQDGRGDESL
jgi:hypothetical protein